MKNHLHILVLVFLCTVSAQAQLYVQPTTGPAPQESYIYANDTFIFVTEDIELVENDVAGSIPSIALRNKAQLLQGNDAATNKGNGEISIFQEGTTDNFDYNFWASPVGTAKNAVNATTIDGNGGFSMIAGQEILKLPSTVLLSSPVTVNNVNLDGNISGSGGVATFNFASRWLYSYQSTTTTSGSTNASWSIVQNSTELDAGWGFSMKGVSGSDTTTAEEGTPNNNNNFTDGEGQRYDFRGRPNNGAITGITVSANENSLVGNPYPSAFDLSYFLLENSGTGTFNTCDAVPVAITRTNVTDGIAYFWESDPDVNSHFLDDYQGGYGTFSPGGDVCTDGMYTAATYLNYDNLGGTDGNTVGNGDATLRRRFSPVGQGFFITGDAGQSTDVVNYNNNQRVYVPEGALNNSQFRNNEDENTPVAGLAVNRTYTDVTNLEKISQIKLAVSVNDTYTRQLALGFIDNATKGIDAAIDAENRSPLGTDISFDLEGALGTEKENGFVINGVPFDESQWVPLLIKVEEISELKFKVFETVDFPFSEVFLYDAQTDLYHDILHDEAFLILAEDLYTERFYIRFTKNTDNSEEEEEEEEEETTEDEETEEDNETTDEEESEDEDTTDEEESEGDNEDTGSDDESEDEDETSDDDEDTGSDDESEDEDETSDNDEDTGSEDEDEDETNTDNDSENDDDTSDDDGTLSVEDQNPFVEESILESFIIVQNNLSRQLEISNPLSIQLNNLMLYDIAGKKVVDLVNLENKDQYIIPTNRYATGVYVVQFITESGLRKSRKISIVN